jgi:hypothetical protein
MADRLDADLADDQLAFWPELVATSPTCEVCCTPLPSDARSDARYCSTTCRVRAHRRRTGTGR